MLKTINKQEKKEIVFEIGCITLEGLISVEKSVRQKIGVDAVVKAINTCIGNADVCEAGCATLWNMTKSNGKTHKQLK